MPSNHRHTVYTVYGVQKSTKNCRLDVNTNHVAVNSVSYNLDRCNRNANEDYLIKAEGSEY